VKHHRITPNKISVNDDDDDEDALRKVGDISVGAFFPLLTSKAVACICELLRQHGPSWNDLLNVHATGSLDKSNKTDSDDDRMDEDSQLPSPPDVSLSSIVFVDNALSAVSLNAYLQSLIEKLQMQVQQGTHTELSAESEFRCNAPVVSTALVTAAAAAGGGSGDDTFPSQCQALRACEGGVHIVFATDSSAARLRSRCCHHVLNFDAPRILDVFNRRKGD
jgi:hypothetical protein